ncbi:MAG: flagellar hook protein FlgE [Hyphomicrobium sp.]
MRTSISGMNVQADRLSSISDNVANVGTTGYKRSTTEFSTVVLQAAELQYESGAVEVRPRRHVSEQGAFDYSSSVTDLAISGVGFFVVESTSGSVLLTRAGAFVPDRDGNLVNSAGAKLLGYDLGDVLGGPVANGPAGLEPVNVGALAVSALPSTSGSLQANLPAGAATIVAADLPGANAATANYSARTSLVAYDNIGTEVTLDLYFSKSAAANDWEVAVFDRSAASATGGFPYTAGPLTTSTITFDGSTGRLATASPTSISVAVPNGATAVVDLEQLSQFSADFAIFDADMNGTGATPIEKVDIGSDGVMTVVYENGSRTPAYRIPIAHVRSPDRMNAVTGNLFQPTSSSGEMLIGSAGAGGMGSVVAGALEQSTVDIAQELTAMIEAQRNYTANSRVFQTSSDLTDVLVNLRS